MNATKVVITICSLLFLMVGMDKFLHFLEPPCSLEESIPTIAWITIGILQLASAVLIWVPKYRKIVAGFFFVFMMFFTLVHVLYNTYDIGGSAFMAVLLGLLLWNPSFMNKKWF